MKNRLGGVPLCTPAHGHCGKAVGQALPIPALRGSDGLRV